MGRDSGLQIDSVGGPKTLAGAVGFLLVGLAITGYGVYDYTQQSDAIDDAVEVDATVTEVGIESQSSSSTRGVNYEPQVRFTYQYDGETYEGTRLFPATTAPEYETESAARDAVREYEAGENVTAYVVPDDPDGAFLRAQRSDTPLTLAGIGGVLSLLGGVLTVKRYREP
ncbi:DUF3592 domain-containing protein [Salinirubellus salinus]|uniref:DUF3592 domain-containing protein n=1 Tax=Salinirubellus salinus TaxID=1364945 RepID=A0A9E7R2V9_9EURY|nr:DUF3592 domain-containing protein [Salinirubellus salinus]UWM53798.1 DUF3592 domain-containing protein [Salinirubellus salinus]